MNSACLVAIALCGAPPDATSLPPSSSQTNTQQVQTQDTEEAPTPDQLREAYRTALRRSAKGARPDPAEVVPQLVAVYIALGDAEDMRRTEIARMQGVVKARLKPFRARLIRDQLREKRTTPSPRRTSRAPTPAKGTAEPAGPAERANAQELIELIQTVIEPEHWNVNGGPGSISYYPNGHALVVRASGGVHEQMGGVLRQLRRLNE